MTQTARSGTIAQTLASLSREGFRLFFPLAAIHAALWPLLWVIVFNFNLPFASSIPPGIWHMHEMIIGTFGAALIGFITTSVPEWTDTTDWAAVCDPRIAPAIFIGKGGGL